MTTGSDGVAPPAGPIPTPARRRRRAPGVVAIGTAALVLAAGGAFAAYSTLNGGGPQPEDALPADVIGYAEIDLDPAAGQKVNAYRLAQRFPDAKVTGEDSLKDDLLRQVFEGEDVDYDRDVKPWVGDRAGLAFMAELDEDDEPVPVAALQYTDRAAAEAGLARLTADAESTAYAFGAEDYVVIAPSVEVAERAVADAARRSLSDNERYTDAVDALGGDQVAVVWADLEGILDLVPDEILAQAGPLADLEVKGSYVLGVSVESDAVELKGKGVGIDLGELGQGGLASGSSGELLARLPDDVLAAASLSGLGESVTTGYDQVLDLLEGDEAVADVLDTADEIGLELPGDLEALLGDELALAVLPGTGSEPDVVARIRGGDPQRALEVIQDVVGYVTDQDPAEVPLDGVVEERDGGLVIASRPDALDEIGEDGDLGDSERFRDAVADPDAPFAVYVDLATLLDEYGASELDLSPSDLADVEPLEAFGLSSGGDEFTMRLTLR